MSDNFPKISRDTKTVGDINIHFEGERYRGLPVLDTRVSIGDNTLCWITWEDKEKFTKELDEVITKFRI